MLLVRLFYLPNSPSYTELKPLIISSIKPVD